MNMAEDIRFACTNRARAVFAHDTQFNERFRLVIPCDGKFPLDLLDIERFHNEIWSLRNLEGACHGQEDGSGDDSIPSE